MFLARDAASFNEKVTAQLKEKKEQLNAAQKTLNKKRKNATYQQKSRHVKKKRWQKLVETYPEANTILKLRQKPGHPNLEEDNPTLFSVILEIAKFGSGADERRRTETIRTVRTLDDLTAELNAKGFQISR